MNIEPVVFELNLDDVERKLLECRIENWFTSSYQTRERLFGDMDSSLNLLNIAQQIKGDAIAIRITKYQAKMLAKVIFDMDSRWNIRTGKVHLPKDSRFYDLYNELMNLAV